MFSRGMGTPTLCDRQLEFPALSIPFARCKYMFVKCGTMRSNSSPGAKSPERLSDKVRECKFFLARMGDYERAEEHENFLYCLSAFLAAFRSATFRLRGVVSSQKDRKSARALTGQLKAHLQIGFLLRVSHVEMHLDGVRVWRRFNINVGDSLPSRWNHGEDRWSERFKERYPTNVVTTQDWQFEGNPTNLMELCHDALVELEDAIRQQNLRPTTT